MCLIEMGDSPAPHAAAVTVSIVIVTYNGRPYLANCLTSVLAQAGHDVKVVVVDNKSSDGSPQFIREHFPAVRLAENRENRGFAAACNQGAQVANGDVLIFLNQDTVVFPGWLAELVAPLALQDDVGLTTSRLRLMSDPDRLHLCGQDVHFTGLVFGRGYGQPAASQPTPCDVDAVSGASFAIRRELWQRLGGFDEALYMYYEETDLSWRVRWAGYRCRYAPDSVALHDYRSSAPSVGRLYYSFRNRALLLLRNWQPGTLLLLAPALLAAELLEWGQALAQGRRGLRAKLRSYRWLFTHGGQVRQMRADVQAQRRVTDAAMLASMTAVVDPVENNYHPALRAFIAGANLLFRLNRRAALRVLGGGRGAAPSAKEEAQP